jgi:HlyD family secretion protein
MTIFARSTPPFFIRAACTARVAPRAQGLTSLLALALLAPALLALVATACTAPNATDTADDPLTRPLLGTLERDRIELVASANEPVIAVDVREGERVTAGQVLVRLDDRRLAASLDAADARVRRADARLAELERGGRAEARQEVRASLARDRSELQQARLDVQRLEHLVASGVASQDLLDAARTRQDGAAAGLERDQARLDELEAGATSEELRQAQADRDIAAAEVADLRVAFERLTVRAPTDGTVDAVPFELGELPGAGSTLVVLMARTAPYARLHVPESTLARATVGTSATIEADGLDAPLDGCLRFVSREATFTPHDALSEYDRHRLAFVAEVVVRGDGDVDLPTGLPVRVRLDPDAARCQP